MSPFRLRTAQRTVVFLLLMFSSAAFAQITGIVVSYTPPSPRVGEPYVATATVTATGPATPTGTVRIFFPGNPENCTTGPLTGTGVTATASCTLTSASAGTKAMQAFYFPGNYGTAPGANVPVTIQPANTTLALKVLPDPSARNRVFVQAVVQPDVGTPTGSFSFTSGSNTCVPAAGENWCSLLPDQSSATPLVSVNFGGDANFLPATAATPITVTDLPWIRRVLSAPLPSQSTDPYSNASVIDAFDAGSWSNDGRYFVFETRQSLVPVDTNGLEDIYLWDERNRSTTLLSYGANTFTPANGSSLAPRISGDGRFVAFHTFASDVVPGDLNGFSDVIRQDLRTGARVRVTPDSANGLSYGVDLSTDGRFLSFVSAASNLVADDTNALPDAFRADLQTASIIRVSVSGQNPGGQGGNPQSLAFGVTEAAINGNGQFVAFITDFNDGDFVLGAGTTSERRPFLRNVTDGNTVYVSAGTALFPSTGLSMSKDSFPTVVWSTGQSLLTPDTNNQTDIYARQPPSGPLRLVSASATGIVGDNGSLDARISGDASTVVFSSSAKNLTAGIDYNAVDIYAKTLGSGAIRRVNVRDGTAATQSVQQFQLASYPAISADASRISFFSGAFDLAPTGGSDGNRLIFLRTAADQRTRAIARRPIGGLGNASSFAASLSANAGFVAITTSASNLVEGLTDGNGRPDIYLRPAAGPGTSTWLISRTPGGQPGNDASDRPVVSAGSAPRVAFESLATDLVAGDTNSALDIFVAASTGPVRRVSVSSAGVQADAGSFQPSISNDGERIVFQSDASNLVANVSGGQIFLHEFTPAVTTLVSRASGANSVPGNAASFAPTISADGRFAVFISGATNLAGGVTLVSSPNAYLRELQAPFTTRVVNLNTAGTSTGNGPAFQVAVDGTGSRVAFVTTATDLLPGDTNGWNDIYVRDVATGTLERASLDPLGNQFTAPAQDPKLSADGRFVAFSINRNFGVEGGYLGGAETYLRDLQTDVTIRVDVAADLSPSDRGANSLAISGNGAYLALVSSSTNLFPGDLNASSDVLLLRNPLAPLPTTLQISSNGPTVTGQPIQATVRLRGDFGLEPRPRGNVTVTGNAGESCTITDIAALGPNASEGVCALSGPLLPGPRTLSASYTPTGTLPDRYAPATGSLTHLVNPGTVSLSTGFAPGTPVVGQTVTFTASLPAASPAVGVPTGTVTVSVGGAISGNCTITLPASSCAIPFANAGSGSVTFSYSGDANFQPAVVNSPITVARANTTIAGSFGPSNPLVGAPVSFTANLAVVSPGVGTPTGQIFVSVTGGVSGNCTITLPATNCLISFNGAGSGTVTFSYAGDANFNVSNSTPQPITVVPASVPTTTAITAVTPSPVSVGNGYTVTVSVGSANGAPGSGTVTISAAGFADTCTITLPATSCSIPAAQTALPGVRSLLASYAGTTGFDPSVSSPRPHTVATTTTTLSVPVLDPAGVVVGQAFAATGTLANPVVGSPLTPTGTLTARVLPLGNVVACTLTPQQVPGVAAYRCPGLISPIAAAKVVELRFAGSADGVFPAAVATATQGVARATTQTRILSDTPDPSNPGQAVAVTAEVRALSPSTSAPSAIGGTVTVGDGVDSCSYVLPATGCTLTLNTSGLRTLTASYLGDANFVASSGTTPHLVTGGVADVSISKRNNLGLLPGGRDVSWLIELRNAGPSGSSALLRDPVPTGLGNFRWTCAASAGALCSAASGTGPLLETVVLPAGGQVSYLLTATVQTAPELAVEQLATLEVPTGVSDPNLGNNVALDRDPIGVLAAGFESGEGTPPEAPGGD